MPSPEGTQARFDAVQAELAAAEAEYAKVNDLNTKAGMAAYHALGEARLNAKATRAPRPEDGWPASKRAPIPDPGF